MTDAGTGQPPKALEQFDIAGRSALVTGAAYGIGLAYAEAMAEAGAQVTLTDVDGAAAEREAARLRAQGYEARADQLDVSDRARTTQVFDAHEAAYGGLDIAFANAGLGIGPGFWKPEGGRDPQGQIDTYDPAIWDRIIAINLTGAYNTMRDAARLMKKGGKGGSIIATSSNAAVICEPIVPMPYMPSKAGVSHMVRHLALELGAYQIRVNAILPGPFVTNIADGSLKDPVVRKAWDDATLMGRIAETYQIKPLALFLASDASSYVTGAQMMIDGGMSLGRLG
ncbi:MULTISPECIES: SDR family NAD(P)-dependent oxidoreductase [Sphingobium]|uniref:SDR family NAD(P)-dependent oxidoreductase n=1 Tax=Sphingobium TaxID=165695 RepID=UPI0015EB73AF|nr:MULTISPECIES: SDR family oxidoreductase [Sphingobium]MCW2361827.1 NAD(P)-dependent dehydrogenase (short-subunit alcohol dehydrogenase family) [Sphingobium sp. B10D3B]MCW2401494.1 NAD(P)-dependent dehydrogenase (short-subunit alcohol dehydrogenase family) [Sphingobium sp. B10D7B]MCW2408474.1 NAD(P)-dependent dehydrogenase (short-subunit alcohol dehydrogenase family) [Sphingobium xanthum]